MNSNIVLISKLITIDHGQYIVRVKAKQENKTIGSALASAHNVEEAEDKARQRILALINQTITSPLSHNSISPQPNVTPNPSSKILSSPKPPATPIAPQKTSTPPPEEKEEIKLSSEPDLTPIASQENIIPDNPLLRETIVSTTNQEIGPENNESESPELPLSYQEKEDLSLSNNNFDLSDAVDFSQVIDQTTIELKRLGWTQEQGKKYLLETYGKKSRHLLSDQELIEFLTYLQTQ